MKFALITLIAFTLVCVCQSYMVLRHPQRFRIKKKFEIHHLHFPHLNASLSEYLEQKFNIDLSFLRHDHHHHHDSHASNHHSSEPFSKSTILSPKLISLFRQTSAGPAQPRPVIPAMAVSGSGKASRPTKMKRQHLKKHRQAFRYVRKVDRPLIDTAATFDNVDSPNRYLRNTPNLDWNLAQMKAIPATARKGFVDENLKNAAEEFNLFLSLPIRNPSTQTLSN